MDDFPNDLSRLGLISGLTKVRGTQMIRRTKSARQLRVRGARGVVLLGFAFMSLLMGLGYGGGPWLGALAVWPPVTRGMFALELVGGLHLWGACWLVTAVLLIRAAFRREQAVAMGFFSGMVSIWTLTYALAFVRDLIEFGHSGLWIWSAIFAAFLTSNIGVARMLNAPPLHVDAIVRRLRQLEAECE